MRLVSAFLSKYSKASDFEDGPRTAQISYVEMERMGNGDMKPVMFFINNVKPLVLNQVNYNVLAELYGEETDGWEGKSIQLFAAETEFSGKRVPCVRLRESSQKKGGSRKDKTLAPAQPQAEQSFDDLDDEIPF